MNDSRIPTGVYLLMLLLGLLHWAHVYPQLPDVVASHFNASGAPSGWAPKSGFFVIMVVVVGVSALAGFLAPRLIQRKPASKINLPNKDYWLSPEHADETWSFLRAQMAWFGCAILFVMLYGTSLAINANLPSVGYFDSRGMIHVMLGFGAFCVLWLANLLRHFYNVPSSPAGMKQ